MLTVWREKNKSGCGCCQEWKNGKCREDKTKELQKPRFEISRGEAAVAALILCSANPPHAYSAALMAPRDGPKIHPSPKKG